MLNKNHLNEMIIVTLAFSIFAAITLGFVSPFQNAIASFISYSDTITIVPHTLHFSHGVIAFALYFCGVRAALYVLPNVFLEEILHAANNGLQIKYVTPLLVMISVLAGAYFYWSVVGIKAKEHIHFDIICLATAISLIKCVLISQSYGYENFHITSIAILLEDVIATILVLLAFLWLKRLVLKVARQLSCTS